MELTRKILEDLDPIIKRVAQKRGCTLVLEKSEGGVLYVDEDYDLTDEVIRIYDREKAKER